MRMRATCVKQRFTANNNRGVAHVWVTVLLLHGVEWP
jgi:hypothetical protein